MTTKVNSSDQRVSSAISLWMFWTVLKPISGSSRKKASRAVTPASLIAARSCVRADAASKSAAVMSDFLDVGPAEQALRQEDERDREDREGGDILVVRREIGRPHGLDQADQQPADHCARQRADAAEHRGGERLHAGHEAVGEIHHAVEHEIHGAGDGGE